MTWLRTLDVGHRGFVHETQKKKHVLSIESSKGKKTDRSFETNTMISKEDLTEAFNKNKKKDDIELFLRQFNAKY